MNWVIEEQMAQEIKDKGVTLTFIAKKTGLKYTTLQSCLKRKRKLKLDEFFILCDFLQINPNIFWVKVQEQVAALSVSVS